MKDEQIRNIVQNNIRNGQQTDTKSMSDADAKRAIAIRKEMEERAAKGK